MGFWVNHPVIRFEQGSLLDVIVLAIARDFDATRLITPFGDGPVIETFENESPSQHDL
jgi:hypothetical protein